MGRGWRRGFCTTTSRDSREENSRSPGSANNGFLSNPTTTPRLRCKTNSESKSNTSSPRSPFSIIKNTLRLSKNGCCGVCLQSVKTSQGMAIYTAECSHSFHFPCITAHIKRNHNSLLCPVCNATWKHVPLLALAIQNQQWETSPRSYEDDEPLLLPTATAGEFQVKPFSISQDVKVSLSPDAAVISVGATHVVYAVVLKVKAPPPPARRLPIDLVTVLDVSGSMSGAKLQMLKRTMSLIISSLGSADRLSIISFSACPERLMPLRRMTTQGQRLARTIIDGLVCSQGTCVGEALRKATKVLDDRREKNPVASVVLLSDDSAHQPKHSHLEIPVQDPVIDGFTKCVGGLLSVGVQDLKIQLGFSSGSISAVNSCHVRPTALNPSCIEIGHLYSEEEREFLVEMSVPFPVAMNHVFSVGWCYKDPMTQELIYSGDHDLLVPTPQSGSKIQRFKNYFITMRAIGESRRLIEHEELSGAMQLLLSARALLMQSRSESASEYVLGLEMELAEVQWKQMNRVQRINERNVDENREPLTPTSASRAAEKLAKVGHVKKSFNRVIDLHGFENARF